MKQRSRVGFGDGVKSMRFGPTGVGVIVVALFLNLNSGAGNATDDTTGSATDAASDAYVGIWLLDLEASDSIEPLMRAMEAPWIARKLANAMTPTMIITPLAEGGLRMINENPISKTDQELPADGVKRARKDPLGRKVVSSEMWSESGQLVITQENHADDGRILGVESTWARVGDRLEITNRFQSEKGPARVLRVFRPKR